MPKKNRFKLLFLQENSQKGVISMLLLIIILVGVPVGVYLVTKGPLKLFSKAAISGSSIQFVGNNGEPITSTTSKNVKVKLTYLPPSPVFIPPTAPINKKVLVIVYDPTLLNGKKVHEEFGWNDPAVLTPQIIASINRGSGGAVNYQVVSTVYKNEFPLKRDGFRYNESTYRACIANSSTCHSPDDMSYASMWNKEDICGKVSSSAIDEVIVWGADYFGFDEFAMKIPGDQVPYNKPSNEWIYELRKKDIPDCNGKTVFVMGYNMLVGVDNAVHSYGHRIESALALTIGRGEWNAKCGAGNDFEKFTCTNYELSSNPSQQVACGNVHFPPNGTIQDGAGYDYDNPDPVPNICESYKNYPFTTPTVKSEGCSVWGCTQKGYMEWWFDHMPRQEGTTSNGNLKNWWKYIADFDNGVKEAKTTGVLGTATSIFGKIKGAVMGVSTLGGGSSTFSNLSATLCSQKATFNFSSSSGSSFDVDMGADPDSFTSGSGIYYSFSSGTNSPIIENNVSKMSQYQVGQTMSWRVKVGDVISPIQLATVTTCPTPTLSSTTYPTHFRIANDKNDLSVAKEQTFDTNGKIIDWELTDGAGTKTVYAQFKLGGYWGGVVHASIELTESETQECTINQFAQSFGSHQGDMGYLPSCDVNADGAINFYDIFDLLNRQPHI